MPEEHFAQISTETEIWVPPWGPRGWAIKGAQKSQKWAPPGSGGLVVAFQVLKVAPTPKWSPRTILQKTGPKKLI